MYEYLYLAIAMLPFQTFFFEALCPQQHPTSTFRVFSRTLERLEDELLRRPWTQENAKNNWDPTVVFFHVQFRSKEYYNCQVIMIACIIT